MIIYYILMNMYVLPYAYPQNYTYLVLVLYFCVIGSL